MIHGNQNSADLLKQYLQKILEHGQGVQFFLLVGPEGVGKSSHAQQSIKSFL
ncbi:MAG: hypothetical protein LBI53_00555 [Candidatus Peribacteria bacterium]|jgi:DNA polymerase III delta prime subunit|nr:hypothetical protein [Candidatus Peribacteria bacterium]